MNLVKWNPFRELEYVSNRLNSLFGRMPAGIETGQLSMADWTPSVDISETDAAYLIKAEIPEVGKEDVKVTVQNGMLTISGERKQEKEEKNRKFHRIERCYGSFTRSFRVPEDADANTVKAEFKDGMLNITLPKSEKPAGKSIDVKIA
jgi:HSP20 family protein